MKKVASAAFVFALLGTAAAYADAHDDRVAVMRSNAGAAKTLGGLVTNFDAAAVKAQGQILVDNGHKIMALFAAGTDQADPGAAPAIWTDAAGFQAIANKFVTDATAVMNAADGPALKAALTTLQGNCGACHKTYRIQAPPRPQ
jgi:cytochrome c556